MVCCSFNFIIIGDKPPLIPVCKEKPSLRFSGKKMAEMVEVGHGRLCWRDVLVSTQCFSPRI